MDSRLRSAFWPIVDARKRRWEWMLRATREDAQKLIRRTLRVGGEQEVACHGVAQVVLRHERRVILAVRRHCGNFFCLRSGSRSMYHESFEDFWRAELFLNGCIDRS